jgi:WD40 repeat protein
MIKNSKNIITGGASIADVVFSPNGKEVALCFKTETILLISTDDFRVTQSLTSVSQVNGISFSNDGRTLASACSEGWLCVFDALNGKLLSKMRSELGGFSTVAWSCDKGIIAGGHYEPWITLFDLVNRKKLRNLDPDIFDDEGRTCVKFLKNKDSLITTAYNKILIWELPKDYSKPNLRIPIKKIGVRGYAHVIDLALSPDEEIIAGLVEIENVSSLYFWELETKKKVGKIKLPFYSRRISWATDGSFIAVAEINGNGLSLWDTSTYKQIKRSFEKGQENDITAVAIHPNSKIIVGGTDNGSIMAWDPFTGKQM